MQLDQATAHSPREQARPTSADWSGRPESLLRIRGLRASPSGRAQLNHSLACGPCAMMWHVTAPTEEIFRMTIRQAFSLTGPKGLFLAGQIESGVPYVGDGDVQASV
jgi:hypothetical protein